MSPTNQPTSVARVADASAGHDIHQRRVAIGISVAELARRAGVDRGRLAALEAGENVRDTTLAAVIRALADLEHELGMDMPSQVAAIPAAEEKANVMRVEVQGVYGAKALVFEAPVENLAELEAMVDRVMRRLAGEEQARSTDT